QNSEVRKTGTLYLNPTPEPAFYLPQTAYKGEVIRLTADNERNRAGKPLSSTWYINGSEWNESEFTVESSRYDVVLVQDDESGLPNSSASLRKTLNVHAPPSLQVELPDAVILGQRLHVSDMNLPAEYVLVQNNSASSDWVGDATGTRSVMIGWKPQRDILETHTFEVEVLERLRAREERLQYRTVFNPVNNNVFVEAPEVNRPEDHVLTYEWVSAASGEVIAKGSSAHLSVSEGWNEFELVITEDAHIVGSRVLRIPVSVQAE
ncbi:hypothetical protein QLX67_12935, partial [Balneolaceae bacterium ANBcel3]|nr:hypothetical protein [Balneolaceae bacterium ANBcel3]